MLSNKRPTRIVVSDNIGNTLFKLLLLVGIVAATVLSILSLVFTLQDNSTGPPGYSFKYIYNILT